jgi:hypothetical protein
MKVVFLQVRKGTSKKGNPYQMVSLAQIMDEAGEKIFINDFFVDSTKDFSSFKFGDVVKTSFVASDYLGGKPQLDGIAREAPSPYIKS